MEEIEVMSDLDMNNVDFSWMEDMYYWSWDNVLFWSMDSWLASIIVLIIIFLYIFSFIAYILQSTWLFLINKKLWEKLPWLAFIPVIQIYSFFTASKKSVLHYGVLPILSLFVAAFLMWILSILWKTWLIIWSILLILSYIYLLVQLIRIIHGISVRCGRWVWTTLLFIFFPYIMYLYVWIKMKKDLVSIAKNKAEELSDEL